MTQSRMTVVELSRGSTWSPQPWEPPFLQADIGHPWSGTATARAMFYDTAGGNLAQINGTVAPDAITFTAVADDMDLIPQGANFEIFLDDGSDTTQIRYGKVIRREAQFVDSPATRVASQALLFTDTFPTLGLRSSWVRVAGKPHVYSNAGTSQPNGVSADPGLLYLSGLNAAMRWFAPLAGDSARVTVNLLNQGAGKTTVVLCSDARMSSYLAVQFEETAHKIHLCTGTGAGLTHTYQGPAITNTVVDGDTYTIAYSDAMKTLSVYKGTSTSPLGSWTDSGNIVPHGLGYRYLGLSFANALLSTGIQVSYWSAKDDV